MEAYVIYRKLSLIPWQTEVTYDEEIREDGEVKFLSFEDDGSYGGGELVEVFAVPEKWLIAIRAKENTNPPGTLKSPQT